MPRCASSIFLPQNRAFTHTAICTHTADHRYYSPNAAALISFLETPRAARRDAEYFSISTPNSNETTLNYCARWYPEHYIACQCELSLRHGVFSEKIREWHRTARGVRREGHAWLRARSRPRAADASSRRVTTSVKQSCPRRNKRRTRGKTLNRPAPE